MKQTLIVAAGLLALSLTSGVWCAPPAKQGGAPTAPKAGQAIERRQVLYISPVRVLGGMDRKDPLPGRLGRGLAEFVGEKLGRSTWVHAERGKPGKLPGAAYFTLESDLTRIGSQPGRANFLWTVRLYREGQERSLEAHWAGSANGVQELETNFRQLPGLHSEGLLGELGERITRVLSSERSDTLLEGFRRIALANYATRNQEAIGVRLEGGTVQQGQDGAFTVPSGSRYTLSLKPANEDTHYVVLRFEGEGKMGRLTLLQGPQIAAALADGEKEHRYLILAKKEGVKAPGTPAVQPSGRVVGGMVQGDSSELAELLREIESAAPGTWSAQSVTVKAVSPAGAGAETAPPMARARQN